MPEPIQSVGAVREELRKLGYLDRGLDRFVLSGKGAPSLLGVSLRLGLAGGLLLGPLLTLAAAGFDRRLLSDPGDLTILAVYAALTLGAATALSALLVGFLASKTRLSGVSLSRNVSLVIGLIGLGYLSLWWRSHAHGATVTAQGVALVVGLLLSLLLARFGSLAAVAVLSTRGRSLPRAGLTKQDLVPLIVLVVLGALGELTLAGAWEHGESAPPPFAVVPTGLKIRFVGIDGLEAGMVDEMPHLSALLASGAHGRLRPEPEPVPAIVWTSIATGRGPEVHGIHGTDSRRLPGMRTAVPWGGGPFGQALASTLDLLRITRTEPPSAGLRGAKTFWNVASEKGLEIGVVNWWATWPAEPVNGFIVSDRALFRLEKGGAPDREVYPPAVFGTLSQIFRGLSAVEPAERLDRFGVGAAEALASSHAPDVDVLYLPGLDIFTMQQLGETPSDLASLDSRVTAVKGYHRFIDGILGDLLSQQAPGEVFVLVGDPGRYSRRLGHAEGILVMKGGPIQKTDLGDASERDLAPTLLHLLGLPVSQELDGHVLAGALTHSFKETHPVRMVASYGSRPRRAETEGAFDKDVVEALKSLGYVQ